MQYLCCGQNTDSEEETQSVKKSKKLPERKQSSSKPDTVLKQDPVVYVSETGNGKMGPSAVVGGGVLLVILLLCS